MEFLKAILGDELYSQFEERVNAFNGNEANKDKQVKVANLGSGEYVSRLKYDDIVKQMAGKQSELDTANVLIADLKKSTEGNEILQGKITGYETQVADLQHELAETEKNYAFNVLLMDAGVKDAETREFLIYKYNKKLTEEGKTLELDENKHIKGADDIIEGFKTSNPTAFDSAGATRKVLGDNKLKQGDPTPATVTKEQFKSMNYEQRVALKKENEQLYNQLKK